MAKTGWKYKGEDFTESDYEQISEEITGFVYVITDQESGEKYIGQKRTKRTKTLPITKTRKRRKKILVESDWRSYYSSSSIIQQAISEGLSDRYTREILRFGYSKGDLNWIEMKYQVDNNVLFDDRYLNGIVNAKIHKKHLSSRLREEEFRAPK